MPARAAHRQRYALRVALLWNGTVFDERTLLAPSQRRVTIGESRKADFVVPATFERDVLFERAEFGYALNAVPGMTGKVVRPGEVVHIDEGRGSRYVTPGDWGVLEVGPVEIFFQFVERVRRPGRVRGVPRLNGALLTALWFSLVAQVLVVLTARLMA